MFNRYSIADLIRSTIRNYNTELYTNIPAIVLSYDIDAQTISCAVAVETPMFGDNVAPHALYDVPVLFPQGSDWFMGGPLRVGDAVLIHCTHYGIEEYLNGAKHEFGKAEIPIYHDIQECVATPGMFTYQQPTRFEALKNVFHIAQGGNYISMDNFTGMKLESPVEVEIKTGFGKVSVKNNLISIDTVAGNITVSASGVAVSAAAITLTGATEVQGALTVTGAVIAESTIAATGAITASEVTAGVSPAAVKLSSHVHEGNLGNPTTAPTPI